MLTGWRFILSKLFIIPQRYVMAIMALFAIANAYTMRVCLNIAITQMVKKESSESGSYDPYACPDLTTLVSSSNTTSTTEYVENDVVLFDWSEATQGLLLSSFYYGYVLTHIPGGMLAERFGGKWVLGLGLLCTAVCTIITPITVKMGGAPALFILRAIEGFGEGPTMPGLMAMVSRWAPKHERARFGSLVFGGAQIGNIAGTYISGLILYNGNWEDVFYVFGLIGILWFLLWTVLCYSTPNTHPYISDSEKQFLNETVDCLKGGQKKLDPTPWKALLRSVPLWALIMAGIGHDWGYFTMVTDLPKYMTDVLKFNIKSTGTLSALPYVAMWIAAFIFGLICDFCIKRGYHSIKNARKIYTSIAATGPGLCIIMASYSGCDTTMAVFWFIFAMVLMGAYYSGMKINPLDISPNYSGTTTAMVNGIAAFSGIIVPYLTGLLTPDSTLKQWRLSFWVCLGVLMTTNLIYILFAQGEQQWWDDVRKHGYPDNWKHGPLKAYSNDTEDQKYVENEEKKEKL
ncbi:putative inorganic phosphate cotransporter [Ostrinia furnacalis]|uniref:putative inorganic phosphate cotransporter n=1 Tax=Ostrinia furnacalis TaxID=93504 RepID=UPI00103B6831|nr:putative inorganic phosphate cotransporter [Ostrinia furnacalis]